MPKWWVQEAQAAAREAVNGAAAGSGGSSGGDWDYSHYSGAGFGEVAPALQGQYQVRVEQLTPLMRATFHPLSLDEETQEWMEVYSPTWWGGILAAPLKWLGYGTADINAMLGTGHMHVLSPSAVAALTADLLPPGPLSLLDVGAGAGEVTDVLVQGLGGSGSITVTATDTSDACVSSLQSKGYTALCQGALHTSSPEFAVDGSFGVVAALNVLDRCAHPTSLLRDMVRLLAPGGVLLLAAVLPWDDFYEVGGVQRSPSQPLPMAGARCCDRTTLERAARQMLGRVLGQPHAMPLQWEEEGEEGEDGGSVIPPGVLRLVRWSRVPYLSQGDATSPVYWLPNAVFVLVKAGGVQGV